MENYWVQINNQIKVELSEEDIGDLDVVDRDSNIEFHFLIGHKSYPIFLHEINKKRGVIKLLVNEKHYEFKIESEFNQFIENFRSEHTPEHFIEFVEAPIPGRILKYFVSPGDRVRKGEPLLVLEAMKMENVITAPADVVVDELLHEVGATIQKNERLIRFEQKEDSSSA